MVHWRHKILCLWSPSSTLRHVVGQGVFGKRSKLDVPSTQMSRRSKVLALLCIRFRTQATTTSTTTNYANVAYDPLTYNMASTTQAMDSNSKWCHCHRMYTIHMSAIRSNEFISFFRDMATILLACSSSKNSGAPLLCAFTLDCTKLNVVT